MAALHPWVYIFLLYTEFSCIDSFMRLLLPAHTSLEFLRQRKHKPDNLPIVNDRCGSQPTKPDISVNEQNPPQLLNHSDSDKSADLGRGLSPEA